MKIYSCYDHEVSDVMLKRNPQREGTRFGTMVCTSSLVSTIISLKPLKVWAALLKYLMVFFLSGLKENSKRNYETGSCKRLGEVKIHFPILGDAKRKEKRVMVRC